MVLQVCLVDQAILFGGKKAGISAEISIDSAEISKAN